MDASSLLPVAARRGGRGTDVADGGVTSGDPLLALSGVQLIGPSSCGEADDADICDDGGDSDSTPSARMLSGDASIMARAARGDRMAGRCGATTCSWCGLWWNECEWPGIAVGGESALSCSGSCSGGTSRSRGKKVGEDAMETRQEQWAAKGRGESGEGTGWRGWLGEDVRMDGCACGCVCE